MSTLINTYPIFEDNQVLTSKQLNDVQRYLEQQNCLTRTNLIGIGVVCGMDLECAQKEGKLTLTITKGVGVTSQGYLITIGKCDTTRYRPYIKPDTVSYSPFEDDGQQDVELFELLTDKAKIDEEDTVTPLSEADEISEDKNFPEDYVVLLFLECYDKDLKSCLGKSCDELGIDRIMTLRKLLISKSDLEKVKGRTNGGMLEAAYPKKYELPKLSIRRLTAPSEATWLYYIGLVAEYLRMIEEVWEPLFDALDNSYEAYAPILEDLYSDNPFEMEAMQQKKEELEAYLSSYSDFSEPVYGIQYFYDFVKDLILAYEEFRLTAFELSGACCPDQLRFPKHLMLGEACAGNNGLCDEVKFRNEFVASPVFSEQRYLSKKVKMQYNRLVLLLESFDLQRLEGSSIKITPSCEKKSFISDRAIPFYYHSKKESSFDELGTLEENWDFDLQRQCRTGEQPTQISYDNNQPGSDLNDPISTPLDYDLDPYNFLRIEGHIGKHLDEIIRDFLDLKSRKNLSFDVKYVYFGDLVGEVSPPACLLQDLQPQYSIWRNKMLLFVKNMVSASQTTENVTTNMYRSSTSANTNFERTFSERNLGINMSDISNVFMGSDPTHFSDSAERMNMALHNISEAGNRSRMSSSAAYESNALASIQELFSNFNDCLHQLIDAMPQSFRDFDMQQWLDAYKCTMRVLVDVMKWMAGIPNNAQTRMQYYAYLLMLTGIYRLLSFLAIHPYITIRVLYDTKQERVEALAKSLQLYQYRINHPGLEHKAGVAPGQTLLLVSQLPQSAEDIRDGNIPDFENFPFATESTDLSFEEYLEATKEMEGRIVADFTLPFTCCDDCEDISVESVTLDPFAPPVARIVRTETKGVSISSYKSVEIQLINDVYEPDIYKASKGQPNFGTARFEERTYEPDPNKAKQILVYDVDPQKLTTAMRQSPEAFFIIDEFNYQIKDTNRDEVVGSDTITIFIPVDRQTEPQTGVITGKVINAQANEPIPDVNIRVKGTQLGTATNVRGSYSIANVPTGSQTIIASFVGYDEKEQQIEVTTGANSINFDMGETEIVGINYESVWEAYDVVEGSQAAISLEKHYSTKMNTAKRKAEDIVKMEGKEEKTLLKKAADTVKEFSDEKEMNVVRLNNEFNKRRNELITEIQNTEGSEKELHKEALKNTTEAYLNRLAYTQPKGFSSTTKDVLNESATIFNAEKEVDMKKTIKDWQKGAKGYVTEDFENNLNDHFKLK